MRLKFILLISLAFLAGCATPNIKKTYQLNPDSGKGVLWGAITYQGSYSGYQVYYRGMNSNLEGKVQSGASSTLIPYFPKGDYGEIGLRGDLFAIELPEGEYEVYNWAVGSGVASVKPTQTVSIKYKVERGRAVYIGNYNFVQTDSMGLTVTGAEVSLRNKINRDLIMFKKKYPQIKDESIYSAVEPELNIEKVGGDYSTTITVMIPIYVGG